jgi:anti-anti-sigma factor
MADVSGDPAVRSERHGEVAVVHAGDYLNRLSGERVERECRERLAEGCRALVVDFRETGMVNSIGVSILLGVIDAAERAGAPVAFAGANEQAARIFDMLGLTRHARLAPTVEEARALLSADVKKNPNSRRSLARA